MNQDENAAQGPADAENTQPAALPWDTIDPAPSQEAAPGDRLLWEAVPAEEPPMPQVAAPAPAVTENPSRNSAWTIPLLCAGIGLIACCLLIPMADENRRLAYESVCLKADLEQLQKQAAVNDEFLKRVAGDPALAERLAQRQMKMVRQGTGVMELKGIDQRTGSPFQLVVLPPPPPLPPYQAVGGRFASLCRQPRVQLYLIGGGLMMIAVGLVLGHSGRE